MMNSFEKPAAIGSWTPILSRTLQDSVREGSASWLVRHVRTASVGRRLDPSVALVLMGVSRGTGFGLLLVR